MLFRICRGTSLAGPAGMRVLAAFSEMPVVRGLAATGRATRILWQRHGYLRSAFSQRCVNADAAPVPWFTYPAIEYLQQLDLRDRTVFEYGSGHSTLFWAGRSRQVVAVEHDAAWSAFVSRQLPGNCQLMLEPDYERYVRAIERSPELFDVISVDGLVQRRGRAKCALLAVRHLKPGGMIVLDNANYLPATSALLREAGLIQVDLSGLGPCNPYAWTTSVFLTRTFDIQPLAGRQPQPPIGSLDQEWEPALTQRLRDGWTPPADWRTADIDALLADLDG
jgi:hypothetical protein